VIKAYKYRIYPTAAQIELINKHFGACRFLYNLALETKLYAYKSHGVNLSAFDLCKQMAELKKDLVWLKELDSQALQASIKKIDVAFKNFFQGKGYPKYKSKHEKQSFQSPHLSKRVDWEKRLLTIPKLKNIPIVLSRKFEGKIKTITISKTPTGKYFASILAETTKQALPIKLIEPNKTIGIDLGLKDFLITSEGIKIENPKYLKNNIERLKILQRRASKKQKGSANRKKANLRVAVQHEKITNKRIDFLQKLSTKLVRENQATTFCFESLAVKNLVKNHNLAQAISDVSWSKFTEMMKYKCAWYGKNFIQIGAFEPSSKLCSNCGNKNETLTLSDRQWQCSKCNATHDRDINAAINIKLMGLKTGLGKPDVSVEQRTIVRAMKQKPKNSDTKYFNPKNNNNNQLI